MNSNNNNGNIFHMPSYSLSEWLRQYECYGMVNNTHEREREKEKRQKIYIKRETE